MVVLWAIEELVKSENEVSLLQWGQLVVVPIVVGFLGYLGVKTSSNAKKAANAAAEAASSVRPNGTGHPSQTAMIEDVLLHVGEVRGDVKTIARELNSHVNSLGHPKTLDLATEANDLSKETHALLQALIRNSTLLPDDSAE